MSQTPDTPASEPVSGPIAETVPEVVQKVAAPVVPPAAAGPTPEQAAKAERARRLASALRDNLKRRKAARPAPTRPGN